MEILKPKMRKETIASITVHVVKRINAMDFSLRYGKVYWAWYIIRISHALEMIHNIVCMLSKAAWYPLSHRWCYLVKIIITHTHTHTILYSYKKGEGKLRDFCHIASLLLMNRLHS